MKTNGPQWWELAAYHRAFDLMRRQAFETLCMCANCRMLREGDQPELPEKQWDWNVFRGLLNPWWPIKVVLGLASMIVLIIMFSEVLWMLNQSSDLSVIVGLVLFLILLVSTWWWGRLITYWINPDLRRK